MRAAIFVDAGYFWVQSVHVIHNTKLPRESIIVDYAILGQELRSQAATQFPHCGLLRIYWYDGPGTHGNKNHGHRAIENLDDFKLRLGTRNTAGDQKAVDGLIIADMIGLAQSRAISDALVISGDADLTPGIIAAQGLGIRVHLLSMGPPKATSPMLLAEADYKTRWDDAIVQKFARAAPSTAAANLPTAAAATPPAIAVAIAPASTANPAVAVSTAGPSNSPAVTPVIQPMTLAAQKVHASLSTAELATITKTGPIPQAVDAKLLRTAYKEVGHTLSDAERKLVRAEFRRQL